MIRCGACHGAPEVADLEWDRCARCGYAPAHTAAYAVVLTRHGVRSMQAVAGMRAALAAVQAANVPTWTIARLHLDEARACQPRVDGPAAPAALQAVLDRCLGATVLYAMEDGDA